MVQKHIVALFLLCIELLPVCAAHELPTLDRIAGRPLAGLSEYEQLVWWEKKYAVAGILQQHAPIKNYDTADATVLHLFSTLLMQASSADDAVRQWRLLGAEYASKVAPKHRCFLALADELIQGLFEKVQSFLSMGAIFMEQELLARTNFHQYLDGLQQSKEATERAFVTIKKKGVRTSVEPHGLVSLQNAIANNPGVPLLDQLKNQRILSVNGLADSKVSFMLHDLFDHYWLLSVVEKHGFFDRYKDFFTAVGDFLPRDIFSRESELVASIGFEFRLFFALHDYQPLFTKDDITNVLLASQQSGVATANQLRALQLMSTVFSDAHKAHILTTVYSGVMVELVEQRRKYGCIKKITDDTLLNAFDPEYTALIVEICALLVSGDLEPNRVMLRIAIQSEQYLRDIACGQTAQPFIGTLDVCANDVQGLLPNHLEKWFEENIGFAATREIIS